MYIESQSVAAQAIQFIISQIWKQVAVKNIEKMVPNNVEKMNVYTFQTIAELHSQHLQLPDRFNYVSQKECMQRDNLLNSFIKIQKIKKSLKTQMSSIPNPSIISDVKNRTKKLNQLKYKTQNSIEYNTFSSKSPSKQPSNRNKQDINNKFVMINSNQSQLRISHNSYQSRNDQTRRNIDFLRDRKIASEQQRIKEQRQFKLNEMKNLQRRQALLKKQKQINKLTYDYDGDFFGSKMTNPQNTLGAAAKIRSQFQKQTPKTNKKQREKIKSLLTASIVNQKLQERYKRMASQQVQNENNKLLFKQNPVAVFANNFSNDDNVSQGVSIKQLSSNFCRFKPLNRGGVKVTLQQFKNRNKNRKFTQFNVKPTKDLETISSFVNKPNIYKSQQNFFQKIHQSLQEERSQKIKPSIVNNIRFKNAFKSEQSSMLSKSKISKSSHTTEKKGTIKVTNQTLFKQVLIENQQYY